MATIKKRGGKNGVSYLIRVSSGYDSAGKQIVHSMTWKPEPNMKKRAIEKELQRQAVLFEEKCAGLMNTGGSTKFEELARDWFKEYAEKQLRPRTADRLHQMEERTYKAIGHIRLEKLTTRHLQMFINNLQEVGISKRKGKATAKDLLTQVAKESGYTIAQLSEAAGISKSTISAAYRRDSIRVESAEKIAKALGTKVTELFTVEETKDTLSPKTIRNYHSFVSSILGYAVKMGMISSNPAQNVTLPSMLQKEKEVYTLEEAQEFLELLKDAPMKYQAFFILAIYGGFRRSELLGLEWEDLDFDSCIVNIRRTSHYTKKDGIYTDTTKTVKSQRTLKLPECVFSVLRQYRAFQNEQRLACGSEWKETQRLFTRQTGGVMHPQTPYHWLERFCKRNQIRFLGIHQFRHLNATLLITSGVDARTVSSALGHSQVSTTLNIYSHTFAETQAKAGEAVAAALSGKVGTA